MLLPILLIGVMVEPQLLHGIRAGCPTSEAKRPHVLSLCCPHVRLKNYSKHVKECVGLIDFMV